MEEVNKDFTPFELAFRMKALGFDEPCISFFFEDGIAFKGYGKPFNHNKHSDISRPTFSQAFRWFRETYILHHSIDPTSDQQNGELGYNYWIWNYKTGEEYHSQNKNRPVGDWEYKHHEEAEFDCLKRLIEIVEINKKWDELKDAGLDERFKGW